VYLTGPSSLSTTTGADGSFSFKNVAAGTYVVCEADPTPDAEQLPANGSSSNAVPCTTGAAFGYSVTLAAGGTISGLSFLNGSGGVGVAF
jgi:hypothetical protein